MSGPRRREWEDGLLDYGTVGDIDEEEVKAAEEAFYAEMVEEPSFEAPVIGDAPEDGAGDEDGEGDAQPNEHGAAHASTRPRRSRNRLLRIMQEFGIVSPRNHVGAAGNTKRIPPQFLFNTREVRLRLAAGLLDSDGHYNPVTNSYHLTQADSWHAQLFEDIHTLFKGLGSVTNVQKWTHESRGYSTLYVGGEHLSDIPCLLARKQAPANARFKKGMAYFRFEGTEEAEERDWVEIDISGDKRFLRNDLLVL